MGALSERSKIRLGLIRTSRSIPRDGRGTSNFLKNPFPQLKWAFFSCPTTKPFSVAPSLEPNSPRSLPRRLQRGPSARFRSEKILGKVFDHHAVACQRLIRGDNPALLQIRSLQKMMGIKLHPATRTGQRCSCAARSWRNAVVPQRGLMKNGDRHCHCLNARRTAPQ
jgi:hypothetical protein